MTRLSEILAMVDNGTGAEYDALYWKCHTERGIDLHESFPLMLYIERLEARLAIAVPALQSIATPALGGKAQQYTAQHALEELKQRE